MNELVELVERIEHYLRQQAELYSPDLLFMGIHPPAPAEQPVSARSVAVLKSEKTTRASELQGPKPKDRAAAL